MKTIDELLRGMVQLQASDLHLAVGSAPMYRIHGDLVPAVPGSAELLAPEMLQHMIYSIITDEQRQTFEQKKELDFSYSIAGVSRYRGNMLFQRGTMGAVLRAIPDRPKTLEELGMPPILKELCKKPRGLVLVTGPTGSGKSTTLAAMVDYVNEHRALHIVTIEDPIEFLHKNKKAVIRQRELGADTLSFTEALKHVLRQDPDVILVGEMRDLETIALALTSAETGHLVFATLHTIGSAATVDRVVDVFPPHQQQQVRTQLAGVIEGVLSQTLVPTIDHKGRVCAMEIMLGTIAIRNLIRESKGHQITNAMQAGGGVGMVTLDAALKRLVASGKISSQDAMARAVDPEEFRLQGGGLGLTK